MELDYVLKESLALIESSPIAMLGSVDGKGFPNIKAMLNMDHEGVKKIWFSTNTSSRRVAQLLENSIACMSSTTMVG